MRHVAALRRVALGTTVAALAVAAPAGAKTLHGTVVHHNASAKSFVLAARSGKLSVVRSRKSPAVGRVAAVKVRRSHGASVARRIRLRGHARHARLRGRVSFSSAHAFAISVAGASIVVRDSGSSPPVGSTVTTTVTIHDDGDLESDDVNEDHPPTAGTMKIEGTITGVDAAARTLTVFADDNCDDQGDDDQGENDQGDDDQGEDQDEDTPASNPPTCTPTVTVHVPDAIDITQFHQGDEVELIVTPQADGSFLLQSVDEDDQGDDNGNDHGSGGVQQGDDHGGDDGNSGPGDGGHDD
jgi:hypothetical protein